MKWLDVVIVVVGLVTFLLAIILLTKTAYQSYLAGDILQPAIFVGLLIFFVGKVVQAFVRGYKIVMGE